MESTIDDVAEQLLSDAYYNPCIDNWCRLIEHYYFYKDQMQSENANLVFQKVEWYREYFSTPQDPILKEQIYLPIYE